MKRLPGAPDPNDPLVVASRYADAEAHDHGIDGAAQKNGMDLATLLYVAEQRALRAVLVRRGREGEVSQTKPSNIKLDTLEQLELRSLTPIYLEAMFIGWRARQIAEAEE